MPHSVPTCPYKKSLPSFSVDSLQELEGCYKIPLESFLLQAEEPKLSQPVLMGNFSLEKLLMPHACLSSRGIWTVPSTLCFNSWLTLNGSSSWTSWLWRSLPTDWFYFFPIFLKRKHLVSLCRLLSILPFRSLAGEDEHDDRQHKQKWKKANLSRIYSEMHTIWITYKYYSLIHGLTGWKKNGREPTKMRVRFTY